MPRILTLDPDKYSAAFAQSAIADSLQNAWGKRGNYPRTQVCQHPCDPGAWAFRPARYPDTSRSRHLSCRLARIWPPPDDAREELRGGQEEEGDTAGDAVELATWLLRGLAEAGSNKKKTASVRLQLLSLDVPLASAVACLSAVCTLTLPIAAAARTAPPLREGADAGAVKRAAASFELRKQQTLDRLENQLPTKRSPYDTAVDLLLEYIGEMMALAAGSSATLFDTLASGDSLSQKKYVAPSGGTLPDKIRMQVLNLITNILRNEAALSPALLYRLIRLSKMSARDIYGESWCGVCVRACACACAQACAYMITYMHIPTYIYAVMHM